MTLNSLVKNFGRNAINPGKIAVQHDLLSANQQDFLLNDLARNQFFFDHTDFLSNTLRFRAEIVFVIVAKFERFF